MSEQNKVRGIQGSTIIEEAPKKKSLVETVSDRYGIEAANSATDRLALVIASQEEPLAADVQDEEPMQQAELPMEQS